MADTFQLRIATPERLLLDAQVTEAECPAANGNMGILPGHAPLLSILGSGLLTYSLPGQTGQASVQLESGFVEVLNDQVRILVGKAEIAEPVTGPSQS